MNYNVKDLLDVCLSSIYLHVPLTQFEIILVDNNSQDGSRDLVLQKYPQVFLVANAFNAGFPRACNQGIRQAKGDFILLLNPDTRLTNASIVYMWEFLQRQTIPIIVVPSILNFDGVQQRSVYSDVNIGSMLMEALFLNRLFSNRIERVSGPIKNAVGACMLFRRELLGKMPLLDENLFWGEDFDLCYRVRKAGGSVYYFSDAAVMHKGGASAESNLSVFYSNYHLSKLKVLIKREKYISYILAEGIILFHFLSRILFISFLLPFSTTWRAKSRAYLAALDMNFRFVFSSISRSSQ